MKITCPNKSHPDFKKMVEEHGELKANMMFFENEGQIILNESEAKPIEVKSYIFEKTNIKASTKSFSDSRLTPLATILSDLDSKASIVSSPSSKLIVDGFINERYILENEISIDELAPLFFDKIMSLKTNHAKLDSLVNEDFWQMDYESQVDYLAVESVKSPSLRKFLVDETVTILNGLGHNVSADNLLFDIIGKHNKIRYVMQSKVEGAGSVRPISGSLEESKQTEMQKSISKKFQDTDNIYDEDNPYIDVNVADFIKAGGNPVLAKGTKTITRYRLKTPINGREFALRRTSDLQKEIVNKFKTDDEIKFQESKSEVQRVTGTSLHSVMEDVIKNYLVKSDDIIFDTINSKLEKGLNFAKTDLRELQKNLYIELLKNDQFKKDRLEYLNGTENPFTDTLTYKQDGKTISKTIAGASLNNYNKLIGSIIGDYIAILKIQAQKDYLINKDLAEADRKRNRPNVYTERKVYEGGKLDGGGTMDLVVIYSDGDYGILDYKFITAEMKKSAESYVLDVEGVQKSYMQSKEKSYNTQLGSYSETMTKVYGARNLVFARIKPTYLQYTTGSNGKVDKDSKVIGVFTSDEAFGLAPITKERTGNKNLDLFLDKLVKQTESIVSDLTARRAWTTDMITLNRLTELKKIIMAIQKEGDISLYTKYANMFLETTKEKLDNNIKNFDKKATIEATNELDFIRYFLENTAGIMKEYAKNFPELISNFQNDIGIILIKVNDIDSRLKDLRVLKMREVSSEVGIDKDTFDSFENAKDISGVQRVMLGMKSVNHPLIQTFSRKVELMNAERIIFQKKMTNELEIQLEELKKWGSKNGLIGSKVFTPILNGRKDLITPWNEDFLKDIDSRKDMSNSENVKWFENNFHRSKVGMNGRPSDEDRFQKAKQQLSDKLDAAYGKTEAAKERIENIKLEWSRKNDINHHEFIGWSFTTFKSPKEPEKYFNDKYKYMMLPANKPLRDFYEYSIKMNYIFKEMVGDGVDIKYNFVANIHKTTLDTMSQDGFKGNGILQKYLNSIGNSAMHNPEDKLGSKDKEIPMLFLDYINTDDKSIDLGKSLLIFGTFINEYKHAVELSDVYNMGRRILLETPLAAVDRQGNKIKSIREVGKFEPAQTSEKAESNLIKAYDSYANVYIYGETTADDAISQALGEKGVKRLDAVRGYVSRAAMSFNILSAAVGSFNTSSQMYSFAANGKYFTTKQVLAAQKAVVSFNAQLAFAEIFFETDPQLSETHVKAGQMSANDLVKKFSKDPVYVFQRWFDNLDAKIILHCTLNNYGINPVTGLVERLDKLKENFAQDPAFKNFEWKSLWDSMENYTDPKGGQGMRIINQHTGKDMTPKFGEKLTNDETLENNVNINTFTSARRIAMSLSSRIKGTQSAEDSASFRHTVLGKVFGQFRTWMPPTMNERLKKEQYNLSMNDFEVGRWTAVYNLAANNLLTAVKMLGKTLIPFVNKDLDDSSNAKLQEMYDNFISNNPNFKNKVSFNDYVNEYKGQMRSLSREIKIFSAIVLTHMALLPLLFAGDDDEDKGFLLNMTNTVLGRLTTELGFYLPAPFTPGWTEFKKLATRDPMPLMRVLDDAEGFISNTLDTSRDAIFGQNNNKDKTGPLFYTANILGAKNAFKYVGITDTDKETNSIWELISNNDGEHSRN